VLEPLGATYLFTRSTGEWRIVVITVHDPDVKLELG
jgi:hypothetical protein